MSSRANARDPAITKTGFRACARNDSPFLHVLRGKNILMPIPKKAVICFSGGVDSTTCFALAKSQDFSCYALSFDYGQRHRSELTAATRIAKKFGAIEHKIIKLPLDLIGGSALTDQNITVPNYLNTGKMPTTYVPARNTIFLAMATGWAETLNIYDIFIGVNAVEYSFYADCRPQYISAFEKVANLATKAGVQGKNFTIHTPLINLNKAEIIKLGLSLGIDYSQTISCYQANELGKACGRCDSCMLRKKGFQDLNIKDPTLYIQS